MPTIQTEIFSSCTEAETEAIAVEIAKLIPNKAIVTLSGNLGAGKSVIVRQIIRILSSDESLEVPSPTYTLLQTYNFKNRGQKDFGAPHTIWHFDLYRLKEPEEIFELGWEDAMAEGVVFIEWPECLGPYEPKEKMVINIETVENAEGMRCDGSNSCRKITLINPYNKFIG